MSKISVQSPVAGVVNLVAIKADQKVAKGETLFIFEAMKMQYPVMAEQDAIIESVDVEQGQTIQAGITVATLSPSQQTSNTESIKTETTHQPLAALQARLELTGDHARAEAAAKRHAKGYRTARENLADLIDEGSMQEYGQLAVAAQRTRMSSEELALKTAGDGIITGTATINQKPAAVVVNDYSVLAGTQGYFHHHKLDRILALARQQQLPVVMYTEGGGGRPGDTDVLTSMGGLHVSSFAEWAGLSGVVPRIAVNNGYCFAGNAALFGCADITIATKNSWIGMAGPAMISGGGLGEFKPTDIGPIDVQSKNGTVDIVAEDEAHATQLAKQLLGYFQGDNENFDVADQQALRNALPEDRRYSYKIRPVIEQVADSNSFLELRREYGQGMVTGFMRIAGKPVGVLANDCMVLGGAVDAVGAEKAGRFIQLCDAFGLPIVALADTPGFMVGPDSDADAAVRRMSRMFVAGAAAKTPWVTVFLRKGYGLGAMAMAGGSFHRPIYTASWPQGEFGAMGLEGAVNLGFSKELAAAPNSEARQELFDELLALLYEKGKATEAASFLELDGVIDPADTRATILAALSNAPKPSGSGRFVDTW